MLNITDPDSLGWLILDRVGILLGYLVLSGVVLWIVRFWRFRRKRRRLAALAGVSRRPRALALSVSGGSIGEAVTQYLARAYAVPIPVDIFEEPGVTTSNVHRLLEQLRRKKEEYQSEGVSELHLFVRAPMAFAVAMGAIFDNWVPVKLYQQTRDGSSYEAWTTLHQAKRPSLDEDLGERVQEMIDERIG